MRGGLSLIILPLSMAGSSFMDSVYDLVFQTNIQNNNNVKISSLYKKKLFSDRLYLQKFSSVKYPQR